MTNEEPEHKSYTAHFKDGSALEVRAYSKEGALSAAMRKYFDTHGKRGGKPTSIAERTE